MRSLAPFSLLASLIWPSAQAVAAAEQRLTERLDTMSDTIKTTAADIKAELAVLSGKLDAANKRGEVRAAGQADAITKLEALIAGPKDTSAIDVDLSDILLGIKAAEGKADAIAAEPPPEPPPAPAPTPDAPPSADAPPSPDAPAA